MEYTNLMMTGNFDEFWFKNMMFACLGHLNIQWDWPRCPSSWHSRHLYPFVIICHAKFSMFGRVKSGTINASQLFFQGSDVFSIFKLRIHACNKNKITTFYRWQWKYLTALLSKFVPYSDHNFKDKCGIKHKIIKKTNPVNTLRPRDSFCFLLVSSHFFYPNFKRPIPSQKWILKQQVRVPLNIPKHSTKTSCPCTNPFRDSTVGGPTFKTNRMKHKYHVLHHSAMQRSTDGFIKPLLETRNHINANKGIPTKGNP